MRCSLQPGSFLMFCVISVSAISTVIAPNPFGIQERTQHDGTEDKNSGSQQQGAHIWTQTSMLPHASNQPDASLIILVYSYIVNFHMFGHSFDWYCFQILMAFF